MVKRSILSDEELLQGAQAIADDVRVGGTGKVMLARVIDDHLDWFERARARGLEWTAITDVLFRAGVTRPDGRPLSRGHLSSLVWRKQKSTKAKAPPSVPVPVPVAGKLKASQQGPSARHRVPVGSVADRASGPRVMSADTPNSVESEPGEHDKLLAFMRRSARARGSE